METSPSWSSILPGWYSNCRFQSFHNKIIYLIFISLFFFFSSHLESFPWLEFDVGVDFFYELYNDSFYKEWERYLYVTLSREWIKSYLFEWFAKQEKTLLGKLTPNIQFWLLQTWSVWILPSPFRSFSCRSWNSPIETWKKTFYIEKCIGCSIASKSCHLGDVRTKVVNKTQNSWTTWRPGYGPGLVVAKSFQDKENLTLKLSGFFR